FLYLNEWDVEGIIGTRRADQSRTGLDGKATINQYIDAYESVLPNLTKHASGWPTPAYLRGIAKQSHTGTEARDLIISAVDKADSRPIWIANWGSDDGNTTGLRQALDHVTATRTQEEYGRFVTRLMYIEVYNQNHLGDPHRNALSYYMDTFFPDMDGGRWYHRWEPLTKNAGGFLASRDLQTNHGPLCARYTITKEGDTGSFMHLIPNGLNVPGNPDFGSWSGRYAYGNIFPGCRPTWACNQRDTLGGSTHRDNTLIPWTTHFQNHFRARADWCVASTFSEANHPPSVVLNADATGGLLRRFARPGAVIPLDATGTMDPDGDALTYEWVHYREAGTYPGTVTIEDPSARTTFFTVPADADGKDIHILLKVTDDGDVPLTHYRRILVRARDSVKIMPLGDSLTDGSHNGIYAGSYRIELERLMNGKGWSWDFVGSKANGASNGLSDESHEGWIGYWTVDAPAGHHDISGDIDLDAKLATYAPDVVLLLIGANDCIHGTSADVAVVDRKIRQLIQQIRDGTGRSTEILVGSLTPNTGSSINARLLEVNARLPGVVEAKAGQGIFVKLVDLYPVVDVSTDLADTCHYDASGAAKVGQAWFSALLPLVQTANQ
ncbi:MAG: DUF1593 domain-containing protein, partial [Deltaproteobacteria bacterium]|nr:DUF1593 domain-containing protein [Deltaproteobacteria bacterium]